MINNLKLINLPSNFPGFFHKELEKCFTLKTCQRSLYAYVGENNPFSDIDKDEYELKEGPKAYLFLLETLCGLQSKVVAENEIVAQFKQSYMGYIQNKQRNNQLLKIIEKLLKDAKEIRSQYLVGLGQRTYSGIARQIVTKARASDTVLILGTGNLSTDLIYSLKKRFKVLVSGRSPHKVVELCQEHNIECVPWKDFKAYAKFPQIVNSIGCERTIFTDENLFYDWKNNNKKRVFIDLGSPSIIETKLQQCDGFVSLKNILDLGAIQDKEKLKKVQEAHNAMESILEKRKVTLDANYRPELRGRYFAN